MSNIREIATFISDGDWIESNDQSNYGIRLVQTGNIGNGEYLDKPDKAKYISEETCSRLNCTDVYEGDILISRLPDPIGRSCIVPQDIGRAITAVDCTILRVNHNIYNPQFFVYYTQTDLYKSRLSHYLTGTTRKRISRKNLENIVVPQYPKKEQDIIVNKLDMITNLISLRKQQLKNFDMLVKSRFIEMFGDPQSNCYNWKIVPLKDVMVGGALNGYFTKPQNYDIEGNVGVICVSDVVNRKYTNVNALRRAFASEKDLQKYCVKYGDMLFCRSSLVKEGIGKASIIPPHTENDILFECHVIKITLDMSRVIPEYLQALSITDFFRIQVIRQSKTATMTTIGQKDIASVNILLPPMELQKRFTEFSAQIDKSKMAIQKSLDELETLKKSLMQTYFG